MTHNDTITVAPALPILVDCKNGEKGDGIASWAGYGHQQIRVFNKQDSEMYGEAKEKKRDRLQQLGRLMAAMAKRDAAEIARWQKELSKVIETENEAISKYNPNTDHEHYVGWKNLMAYLGVKPDQHRWYGRRERRKKLDSFFGTDILRVLGLDASIYSPPPVGRTGSKAREQRKQYDKNFKRQLRAQERKLDEILAGQRLAPSLENEISLSHWQISNLLSGARLVLWHYKRSFTPALYCGEDLDAAYWAYVFTRRFVAVPPQPALCLFCGTPFKPKRNKDYCCSAHRAAAAQQRYRANVAKKREPQSSVTAVP